MPRRALTSTAVALLLALVPATAFADGAGDEQYQDPLAAPKAPKKKAAATAPSSSTTTPAAATAPAASTTPTSTSSTQPASSASSASQRQLPRTGAPADLIGLGGATLVVAGAALRRRTASQ